MIPVALLVLAASATVSLILTPVLRRLAERRGWLDRPDGRRKLHPVPVPRIGGVAVFVAFAVSAVLLASATPDRVAHPEVGPSLHLLAACALVMLAGLADDLRGIRPSAKLAVQALAGLYLYAAGYRIAALSNPFSGEPVSLGALSLPLTLLWFVGVSNAFNLIDGLDGLAAGIGLFSTTTLFIAAVLNERWEVALLATALAGALLGFLPYNRSPASIFLGDSGALFVGLALAGLAVRGNMKSSAAIAVAAPLLALGVPLLDTGIAVARRVLRGRPVLDPDVDHIHHRMLRRGMGPQRVVAVLYAIAALFGALSLLTITERGQVIGLVVIVTCLATWAGITQLGYGAGVGPAAPPEPLPATAAEGPAELRARFARAPDLAALWQELTAAARESGFFEIALEPGREWEDLVAGVVRAGQLPMSFPRWRGPNGGIDPETGLSTLRWTVPLAAEGRALGSLVLTARAHTAPASLLPWAGGIAGGFAPRWLELLTAVRSAEPPATAADVGRAGGTGAA